MEHEDKTFEELTRAEHFEQIRDLVTDLGRMLRDDGFGTRIATMVVRHARALLEPGPGCTAPHQANALRLTLPKEPVNDADDTVWW